MGSIDREINTFIDNKYMVGALLINGKWGAGKTWTIKRIIKEYSRPSKWKLWNWRKFRFVSLFGITEVSQFKNSLRSIYSPICYSFSKIIGFLGIAAILGFVPNLGTLIGKWLNISYSETPYYELYGLKGSFIASFIVFILLIIFYYFANKNIAKRKFIQQNVFIFDDMERCDLPMKTLLGLVNNLVERGIKVILIANEDNIPKEKEDEYKEFKEKIVASTLYYSASNSIDDAFNSFCEKCKKEYKNFLTKNKDIIIDSFSKYAEENIRALINALSMFENIFQILRRKSFKDKDKILMNFLRVFYLVSKGHNVTKIYDSLPYGGLLARHKKSDDNISNEENIKLNLENMIVSICSDAYFVRPLAIWIEMGYLDEELFERELEKIAKEQMPKDIIQISNSEKLLAGWNLESFPDDVLLNTYNEALNIAYDGKTDFDGYIYLMRSDVRLDILKIKHMPIDWSKLENGLSKYFDSIKAKAIENTEAPLVLRHVFISDKDLNKYYSDSAKRIYKIIDNYNPAVEKNHIDLLEALKSKNVDDIIFLMQNKKFRTIDNEMCDAFLAVYQNTKIPEEKSQLSNAWSEMADSIIAINKNKLSPESYNSIEKLKDNIVNIQPADNSISQKINKAFIDYLTKLISTVSPTQATT